jgi:iron complex transport system ATP-binding protein
MALTDITHLADHAITDLSGGERQRVLIARALAQEPGIILLDEPNAHLDIAHQIEVFTLLQRLNRDSHLTVVSVSHDLNLAAIFSERIAMMANGTLVAVGTPSEVLTESRINAVFKTSVLVDRHPLRNAPRISLPG